MQEEKSIVGVIDVSLASFPTHNLVATLVKMNKLMNWIMYMAQIGVCNVFLPCKA
jgi:hypothetical protein